MRHRNVWAAGLALGLGMGMVGLALGQEPARSGPGLLDRLFTSAPPPLVHSDLPDAKKKQDGPAAAPRPRVSREQALRDFYRRMEVCDKLRQIADINGDDELKNRADVLEMRAKDIYVQRTNQGSALSAEEQILERNLVPAGRNLTPLSMPMGNGGNGQAFAEGRR
jgi:hypothetical protein